MSDKKQIDWVAAGYDFLDFGCSDGANIHFVKNLWPSLSECGIDIDARKIKRAVENGCHAVVFNIFDLPSEKITSFVTMSHFLEHINSVSEAKKFINISIGIAKDFVLIRQPWFDADGLLLNYGLKFFWSDWSGHPNRMSVLDFYLILTSQLAAGRIRGFELYGRRQVKTTDDPSIIPLGAPINQHHFDVEKHGAKPPVSKLSVPVFKEIVAVIKIEQDSRSEEILRKLGGLTPLYNSAAK